LASAAEIVAPGYVVDQLVPGSPFNGVHGLRFDRDGALFVGSLAKQCIYRVDPATKAVSLAVGPPHGEADDVAFAPDGTLYWTAPDSGSIFAKAADGPIRTVARGLPGINGITFRQGGRLYASTVFLGDALYEIDPAGETPPRLILEGIGGLNGNEFGPDDRLYGPLWFKGQVARIDVDQPDLTVVADGFMRPSAVKVGPDGNLWMVDAGLGRLFNLDRLSGRTIRTVELSPSIDNLALDGQGRVYVTNMADNSIQEIDPDDGAVRDVVRGALSLPGGIAIEERDGRELLHIADQYAYRIAATASGALREVARRGGGDNNIPSSVSVGPRFILLSSLRTRSVELRDRRTLKRVETIDGFTFPYQALEIPAGILVADHGSSSLVLVRGEPGTRLREDVVTGLAGPVALLPAGDGGVYVAEADGGRVLFVDLSARTVRVVAHGFDRPEGIAFLDDGALLVAEVGARRLTAVRLDGPDRRVIAENLPIGQAGPPGWPAAFVPTGVAVGRSGVIYFASDLDCAIYRLTPRAGAGA
jgi:sugar lactone lactonase YvrE